MKLGRAIIPFILTILEFSAATAIPSEPVVDPGEHLPLGGSVEFHGSAEFGKEVLVILGDVAKALREHTAAGSRVVNALEEVKDSLDANTAAQGFQGIDRDLEDLLKLDGLL